MFKAHNSPFNLGLLLLFSIATCLAVLASTGWSQAGPQNAFVRKISLSVADKEGAVIRDIKKDELIVTVNDKQITDFDLEFQPQPSAFVLAVDNSGSLRQIFSDVTKSAQAIYRHKTDKNLVLLMRFVSKDKIQTAEKFTSDIVYLDEKMALFGLEGGQTALVDAIYKAVQLVSKQGGIGDDHRRAVIVISDGEDRDSSNTVQALQDLIANENVQVYFLGLTEMFSKDFGYVGKSPKKKSEEFIKSIARESGGAALFPKMTELESAAVKLVRMLNQQYSLTIRTPVDLPKDAKVNIAFAPGSERKNAALNYKARVN